MIFVTVGAQMPFDRLIAAVDRWVALRGRQDVWAQIGQSRYHPAHLQHVAFLDPPQFRAAFQAADIVVAHAGMGTIINALELRKPILVMPRRGDLAETRNDHQVATARTLSGLRLLEVARDADELVAGLDRLDERSLAQRPAAHTCLHKAGGCPIAAPHICSQLRPGYGCPNLLSALQLFLSTGTRVPATDKRSTTNGKSDGAGGHEA